MRAGQLRHSIILQTKTVTRDTFNAEVETWGADVTVRAKVETPSGDEAIVQQMAGAAVTHKITLRHRAGLAPTMRVLWGDRILDIVAVLPDNLNHETVLACSEVVSG